ncbi:MAG: GrpB family protein, partial [Elusimicrobiota bacterium]
MTDDLIEIVPYDPAWPGLFALERDALLKALDGRREAPAVEHVGSTAVPDLAAKPTIDLMIGVDD